MGLKRRVLGSAVLTAAFVSVAPLNVLAAPAQEVKVFDEDNSLNVTAGMARKITEGLQSSDEEAPIKEEKTEISSEEDSSNVAAGVARRITESFQSSDEASIEKKEVEVVSAPELSEEEAAWQSRLMANVEESLNVRAETNEEAELAGKLRKGDMAEIVEQGAEWTLIASGNVNGYVKNEFCIFGLDAYHYAQENCTTNATVLEGGLRLRAEANEEAAIYDVAAQGDVLTVSKETETPEGWVAVTRDGNVAFVSAQYVEVSLETGTGITIEEEQAMIAKQKAEEEARAAEEAREAAAAQQSAPTQNEAITTSYDETSVLAAAIQLEAGGEPYDGQVAVGAVIMNRVRSGAYPGSISGVVYQPGQFSVSGRIAGTIASGIRSSCMQAAQAALSGADNTGGALSFAPVSSGKGGLVIGNHVFY
ncbi:MAG: SH3 domain-containing protein [Lachnospiraceae bacterium]|nr:SH3 domain-containing protein [Lachnospiraceae bacterium]